MKTYFKHRILAIILFSAIITSFPLFSFADELSINSYVDKTTIGIDDVLKLTVELSGENVARISKVDLPEIDGFTVIGSSTSSSSSFSVVGGRMTSSVTRSNIYTLKPTNTGQYLIPPITVQFKGNSYTTNPIRIRVVEGTTQPPPPVSQQFRQPEPEAESLADNIFIIADIPKNTIYRGEPLVVRYKIYSRYDIANLSFVSEPNFVGFWKDDVFFANRMNFQRENYQGRLFNSMLLRTITLYPSQAGNLTIPAFNISADIIARRRSFWDYDSTRKVNLQSEPINIEVKDLPPQGRPPEFTGAVGSFGISSDISDNTVNVGDPITITLTISGNGNFRHFNPPALQNVPFLRLLDPEITSETKVEGNRVVGSKTISYHNILTQAGDFEIPAITFSAFDPVANRYQTLRTQPYSITAHAVDSPSYIVGHSQQDVTAEGADIFYIRRDAQLKTEQPLVKNWLYRVLWALSLLTVPAAFVYGNEKDKLMRDKTHLRQRLARKILKKYMKLATAGAKAGDMSFYANAANGLSNYLTDILKISRGSTTETIMETMQRKGYPDNCLERVKIIMQKFMEARFKPGGFNKDMINADYQELISVINEVSACKAKQ